MRENTEIIQEYWKKDSVENNFDDEEYKKTIKNIHKEKAISTKESSWKVEQLKKELENNKDKNNKIPKWRKAICTGKTDKNDNISVIYNKNQWKKILINNEEYKTKETDPIKDWGSMILETKIWYLKIKRSMSSKKIEWLSFRKNLEWSQWEIQTEEIYKIKLLNQYEEQYREFYKSWTNYKDTKNWKNKKPFWKRIKDFFNNIFVNKTKQEN